MISTALEAAATVVLIELAARLHTHHSAKTTADATQAPATARHAVPRLPRRIYPATPEPEHSGPAVRPHLVPPLQTAGAPTNPPADAPARRRSTPDMWFSPSWPPLNTRASDEHMSETVT